MKKKRDVVMLPTEKASNLFLHKGGDLCFNIKGVREKTDYITPQYLYILSDEEIKEGDWFFSRATRKILFASKEMLSWNSDTTQEHKAWRKIIATNNPEISHTGGSSLKNPTKFLSQISQDFIEAYIKAYNEALDGKHGSAILEVMVEYELSVQHGDYKDRTNKVEEILKLRPDNTIIISRVKEKYTHEEVLDLIKRSWTEGASFGHWNLNSYYLEQFIKENLK